MIDSQIKQLYSIGSKQLSTLGEVKGGVDTTNHSLHDVFSSVTSVREAVAGNTVTKVERILSDSSDSMKDLIGTTNVNTDRIARALERPDTGSMVTSAPNTDRHLKSLSESTDIGNAQLSAINQVMEGLKTQSLVSSITASQNTGREFDATRGTIRELGSGISDVNRTLSEGLRDVSRDITHSIQELGTPSAIPPSNPPVPPVPTPGHPSPSGSHSNSGNGGHGGNPIPPVPSPPIPHHDTGSDAPTLGEITGFAGVMQAIKTSLPAVIATAVGGAIITAFDKLDRLTGEASSIFMAPLGKTREEAFGMYQDILTMSRDLSKEMSPNPLLGYKISVEEWEDAMSKAIDTGAKAPEVIKGMTEVQAISSKIMPDVDMASYDMFKEVIGRYEDGADRMKQVAALTSEYSQNMWVKPETIMEVSDEYGSFVKSISANSGKYVQNMNKIMKATAALEDSFLDAGKMIGEAMESAFTPLSELDTQEYTKMAMLGLDTMKYRQLMQSGNVDQAMEMYTGAIQDKFSKYKKADGSFDVNEQFLMEASMAGIDPQEIMSIVSGNKGDKVSAALDKADGIGKPLETSADAANQQLNQTLKDNVYVPYTDQVQNAAGTEMRLLDPLNSINSWMASLNEKTLPELLIPIGVAVAGLAAGYMAFKGIKGMVGGLTERLGGRGAQGKGGLLGKIGDVLGGNKEGNCCCCCEGVGRGVLGGSGGAGGGAGGLVGDIASTAMDMAGDRRQQVPTVTPDGSAKPGTTGPAPQPTQPKQGFFSRMKTGVSNIASDFKASRGAGANPFAAAKTSLEMANKRRVTAKQLDGANNTKFMDKMKGMMNSGVEKTKAFSGSMVDKTKELASKVRPTPAPTGGALATATTTGASSAVGGGIKGGLAKAGSTLGNVASKAAMPLMLGMEAYNIYKADDKVKATGEAAGGIGGALAGAAIGQAAIPIPILGAAIGGIVGSMGGSSLGGAIVDFFRGDDEKKKEEAKPTDPTKGQNTEVPKPDPYANPVLAGQSAAQYNSWENSTLGMPTQITASSAVPSINGIPGNPTVNPQVVTQAMSYSPYANGGVIDKPHLGLVGEEGKEVIIPLSSEKRERAMGLWEYAGNELGATDAKSEPRGVVPSVLGLAAATTPLGLISSGLESSGLASTIGSSSAVYETEAQSDSIRNSSVNSERVDGGEVVNAIQTLTSVVSAKLDRLIQVEETLLNKQVDDKNKPHSPAEPGVLTAGARDIRNFI